MKCVITFLVFVLLTTSACKNHDEVLPRPPASDEGLTPVPAEEEPEEVTPPTDLNLEVYQYGSFEGMPYRILFPRDYDSLEHYPLHLFLHGIGERGSDNEKQLLVGASFFQADSIRNKYRALVVFPQCPANEFWFRDPMTRKLSAFIDTLTARYLVLDEKISIGGFSMGAFGTFAMVATNPDFFQTAVAISGDGDEDQASLMTKTRWQIFAGQKDHIVPANKTKKMAEALVKAGASVSFTLFPEADHSATWLEAFSQPDFFYKLFPMEKQRPTEKGISTEFTN